MCGLAGIFNLAGQQINIQYLRDMTAVLEHRGPDDYGIWNEGSIGLGHQRLSILDLSSAGHQPMSNERGDLHLVYNGEIYNYIELREELQARGHYFKSQSDTEVVLAAYEEYGIDCLKRFNGMWAFALWDSRQELLFCARDRFGIKPFFYSLHQNQFVFASEAKALLSQYPELAQPNACSIYHYLTTGISEHSEQTFFQNIYHLNAGHYVIVRPGATHILQESYWYLPEEIFETQDHSPAMTFRNLLTDSIHLRLRSDVPIGTCLSGGLDSSSLVCLAKSIIEKEPQSQYQQHTFSSCFDVKAFDERFFIEKVLQATDAHSHYIFPDAERLESVLNHLLYHQDEPFGSLSIFAQYCVMEKVNQNGIKVLLDGQGADESLAGYGYDGLLWADLLRKRQLGALSGEMQVASFRSFLKRFLKMLMPSLAFKRNYQANIDWLDSDFVKTYQTQPLILQKPFKSHLKNQLFNLFQLRLPSLLRYEDRNSMAFSIESRLPFLDYRLVTFAFSLGEDLLIRKGWSKWILREAMEGVLPGDIQWRKDKMGFVTPQTLWFRQQLRPFIQELFSSHSFQQSSFWNAGDVQAQYARFLKGEDDSLSEKLWRFINCELWLNQLNRFRI